MSSNAIQQYRECQPPDASPNTVQQYVDELNRLNRHLVETERIDLTEGGIIHVQPEHLLRYHQTRGMSISSQSLNKYTAAIRSFFSFHKTLKTIPDDPSEVLHYVKPKYKAAVHPNQKKPRYYSLDQIQAILGYLERHGSKEKRRDAALIALMSASCLRIGEACSLKISDMDTIREGHCLVLGKHGVWEEAHVADFAVQYLDRYLTARQNAAPEDPLFLSRAGARLTPNAAWKAFKRTQDVLNLQTGTHILRHTAITFIAHFTGVLEARDAARHKSIHTTNGYVHGMDDLISKAVNENQLAMTLNKKIGKFKIC